jgi:hypothetical protein
MWYVCMYVMLDVSLSVSQAIPSNLKHLILMNVQCFQHLPQSRDGPVDIGQFLQCSCSSLLLPMASLVPVVFPFQHMWAQQPHVTNSCHKRSGGRPQNRFPIGLHVFWWAWWSAESWETVECVLDDSLLVRWSPV